MRIVKLLVIIVLFVVGWLFSWSNGEYLPLQIMQYQTPKLPVFVWYFLFILVGFLGGITLGRLLPRK